MPTLNNEKTAVDVTEMSPTDTGSAEASPDETEQTEKIGQLATFVLMLRSETAEPSGLGASRSLSWAQRDNKSAAGRDSSEAMADGSLGLSFSFLPAERTPRTLPTGRKKEGDLCLRSDLWKVWSQAYSR